MLHRFTRAALTGGSTLPLVAAALIVSGCDRGELLDVRTPDQITPGAAANAAGANAQRIAAIGNFATFYAGDVSGSGVGLAVASGLLSDEMESARGGTEHLDSRAQNESLFPVTSPWSFAGQAQTQLRRAMPLLEQFVPASATRTSQIAELHALLGFTYVLLGENYCGAVPIGDANDESPSVEILNNTQLFQRAITEFDAVNTTLGTQADDNMRRLAAVGRARALLNLNQPAQAAAVFTTTSVPTSYVYNVTYSTSTIVNAMYDWMNATLNFAPADREGGVGLDFVSANDPRVTVRRGTNGAPTPRAGQDGVNHFTQTVFTLPNSAVPLATGIEARLIEAEAMVRANDPTYITKVNEARATRTDLPALAPAATQAAQVDQVMRERGFWFWGTAHRVGDLRRLMRQYNRTQAEVWPSGAYFKGGNFGTHVTLRPSQAEQNNPDYDPAACVPTTA
jgi:starch-binding outer membrane protein, SusD/RagB family